jgi:hypothetical protein
MSIGKWLQRLIDKLRGKVKPAPEPVTPVVPVDTDHGAFRPSYTMPQSVVVALPATCILYSRNGVALAYFVTDSHNKRGRLP